MVFHMKTTLVIEDGLMRRLKALAAKRGQTLSSLVESFLRAGLHSEATVARDRSRGVDLPAWDMGRELVDISDRAALDEAMREDRDVRR